MLIIALWVTAWYQSILLGDDLEGVHTLIDKTRTQYNQVQLSGTEFFSDTMMGSGNIYWRNMIKALITVT